MCVSGKYNAETTLSCKKLNLYSEAKTVQSSGDGNSTPLLVTVPYEPM